MEIEIKINKCFNCPFWDIMDGVGYCNHPMNYYDGNRESEFIEHCPLKQGKTTIVWEREQPTDH